MLTIYGSKQCPDCVACKANFDAFGIEYTFAEVLDNLKNLKTFLHYRDTEPVFERLIKVGDIGLPAIVKEDGTVFTDWEDYLRKMGKEPVSASSSCSLNGNGC